MELNWAESVSVAVNVDRVWVQPDVEKSINLCLLSVKESGRSAQDGGAYSGIDWRASSDFEYLRSSISLSWIFHSPVERQFLFGLFAARAFQVEPLEKRKLLRSNYPSIAFLKDMRKLWRTRLKYQIEIKREFVFQATKEMNSSFSEDQKLWVSGGLK